MKLKQAGLCLLMFFASLNGAISQTGEAFHRNSLENKASSKSGAGLSISWFGAASTLIDDGSESLLLDPFVSRENNSALDIFFRRPAEVDKARVFRRSSRPEYQRAKAIVVGHSHYDHILDVAAFASYLNIPVFGSQSSGRIVRGHGLQSYETIYVGDSFEAGGFRVTVYPGNHARPPFIFDPLNRSVSEEFLLPTSLNAYGRGEVYTYLIEHELGSVLHIGTAGFVPKSLQKLKGKVDVVLLSLVGRGNTRKYLASTVGAVQPRFAIPIHFDNIFQTIDEPMTIPSIAKLDEFFATMEKVYPAVETGIIEFDEPWTVPTSR